MKKEKLNPLFFKKLPNGNVLYLGDPIQDALTAIRKARKMAHAHPKTMDKIDMQKMDKKKKTLEIFGKPITTYSKKELVEIVEIVSKYNKIASELKCPFCNKKHLDGNKMADELKKV